jgi:hypothetical protein
MKEKLVEGTRLKEQLDTENKALKTELDACRKVINITSTENIRETSREREPPRQISGQVLPSLVGRSANTSTKNKSEESRERERVPPNAAGRQLLPSLGGTTELYTDVVTGHDEKKFKITIRTKGTQTPDEIKSLLKEKVKLTEIKVGIQSLKPLRDRRVITEVGSKREMESLEERIRERCGDKHPETKRTKVSHSKHPKLNNHGNHQGDPNTTKH